MNDFYPNIIELIKLNLMKMNVLQYIVVLFLILPTIGNAQEAISEGVITMELTDVDSEDQQMAAQLEMMKGTETNYYFNNAKYLTTSNMMGGMVKMQNLFRVSDEQLTLLFDVMGQKMMVESSKEERMEMEAEQNAALEGIEVVYDKEDTKEIMGYKCHKAMIETNEGEIPMKLIMYISPEVKASNKMIQGLQGFEIDGFPMELVMDMGKMSMTYTTTEISRDLDNSIFNLETSGYKKMTLDEFQEQMGAMGGGLGF